MAYYGFPADRNLFDEDGNVGNTLVLCVGEIKPKYIVITTAAEAALRSR